MNRVVGGDYSLLRALSAGGMGEVFVAEQLSTGKHRALKLMKPELARDARFRERFVLEAKVGARIESEHVVEVVGAGIDEATGSPWLAMELLDGEDLATSIGRRGPLPFVEVVEVFKQLGHALSKAHAAGVVHRDLKPENLFVAKPRRDGIPFTIKVLDFGIAKLLSDAAGTAVGATGAIGTPLWMSPEQADSGGRVTSATDIWPLGLMAYFALTARHYWHAATMDVGVTALLKEVLFDPLDPPSIRANAEGAAPQALPPGFDAWFFRCVAREPGARFGSVHEAVEALASLGPSAMIDGRHGNAALVAATVSEAAGAPSPLAATQAARPAASPMIGPTPITAALSAPSVPPVPLAARRSRRVWPFALVALVVVAAPFLLFFGLRAYFKKQREDIRNPPPTKDDIAAAKRVDDLLAMPGMPRFGGSAGPIPVEPDDPAVGTDQPLVVATIFCGWKDLECERLAKVADEVLKEPGVHLRVVYKSAVPRNDEEGQLAAQAALGVYAAAGSVGFITFRDLVFAHRGEITRSNLVAWARIAGVLDVDAFGKRLDEKRWTPRVDRDGDLAARLRLTQSTTFANCAPAASRFDFYPALAKAKLELLDMDDRSRDGGSINLWEFDPYRHQCLEREQENKPDLSRLPVIVRSPFASDSSDDAARDAVIRYVVASARRDAKALAPFVADSIKALGRDVPREKFVSERTTTARGPEPLALVSVALSPDPNDRASRTAAIELLVPGIAPEPRRKAVQVNGGTQAVARVVTQTLHVIRSPAGWQVDQESERAAFAPATCVDQLKTSMLTTTEVARPLLAPLSRAEQEERCLVRVADPWLCEPTYKCLVSVDCHRGTSLGAVGTLELEPATGTLRMRGDDDRPQVIAFDAARAAEYRAACSDAGAGSKNE